MAVLYKLCLGAGVAVFLLAAPAGRAGQIGLHGTWSVVGGGSWVSNAINSLAVADANVYAANYAYVSRLAGTNWNTMGGYVGATALCVTAVNGQFYAGGSFQNGTPKRVASWNGSSWVAMDTGFASGAVNALVGSGGTLYAGGSFASPAGRVAAWNGSSWAGLATTLTGAAVNALAPDSSGNLYAGGGFGLADNANGNNIAKWNGANWTNLGSGVNGKVSALAFDRTGNLYAGGGFSQAGGVTVNGIAKWDGNAWTGLGSGVTGGVVNALAVASDGTLYVGGAFTNAGGALGTWRIAMWNGANWSAAGPSNGMDNTVNALAASSSNGIVYAGGMFTKAGTLSVHFVAKWTPGVSTGVCPSAAFAGDSVTITGTDLSDGTINDIASVTLCGVAASVQSVAGSTQVVVTAGAGGLGLGDVVVSSVTHGSSVSANGFQYKMAPTIVNCGADPVAQNSATLNASLSSTGALPTTVRFYWGPTDGGITNGNWASGSNLGIRSAGPVSTSVTGLTAQTLYYYRAWASNADGVAWAPASTNFSTRSATPRTLVVASSFGTPVPGTGTFDNDTVVAARVDGSPVGGGAGTQFVCTGWTLCGNVPGSGTSTNFTLTLTNDATLTWTWSTNVAFGVAAGPNGSVGGSGGGWYTLGGSVTVTGVPGFGYCFIGWSGDVPDAQASQNPLVLTLDQTRAVTASFAINHYTLSADPGVHGQVTPASADVMHGGQAEFLATADPNYRIADIRTNGVSVGGTWRNADTTNHFVWSNVQGDGTLSVLFAPQVWTIAVAAGAHGTITPAGTNVNGGADATFLVSADSQWHVQDVAVDSVSVGATNAVTFVNVTADHALTASFAPDASACHWADGYRSPGTNAVSCVFSNSSGRQLLSLLCRPSLPAGWTLADVSGDGAPEIMNGEIVFLGSLVRQPLSFAYTVVVPPNAIGVQTVADELEYQTSGMSVAAAVQAAPDPLVLTGRQAFVISSAYGGACPAVGSYLVDQGALLSCAVTNSPVAGEQQGTQYVCVGWTGTGSVTPATGTGTNIPTFAVTGDSTLTWLWSTQCWLNVASDRGGDVSVSSGWHDWGGSIAITATPWNGFVFSNWCGDVPEDLRTSSTLTLPIDQVRSIEATFAVRLSAAVASHACAGYRSPGTNNTVSCTFEYPADQVLTSLVWCPVLPGGWTLASAFGSGNPTVAGSNLVFSASLTNNPLVFGYTFAVPAGAAVTGTLHAEARYLYSGVEQPDPMSVAPGDLTVSRFHSADYQTNYWVIDNSEINRVLAYWRAGGYGISSNSPDGFAPTSSPDPSDAGAGLHSADYQAPYRTIDAQEMNRVLVYWRAGGYHVSPGTCDGYAPGLPETQVRPQLRVSRPLDLSGPVLSQSAAAVYDPGKILTVTNILNFSGSLWGLYWRPMLPAGWTLVSVTNLDANGPLPEVVNGEILWTSAKLASPVGMSYQVRVPAEEVRARSIRAQVGYWVAGQLAENLSAPDAWVAVARDTDGDGLPDAYEMRFTGSTTNMLPSEDLDGDGMSNLAECLAGTDPTQALSVLKVTAISPQADGNILICWQSATNQVYDIQRSTNLSLGFISILTNIPATPPENACPVAPVAGGVDFLRILVE